MAAVTFQALIDRARAKLNDADKTRYSDTDALRDANNGVLAMLNQRPDIFFGQLTTMKVDGNYLATDVVPCNGRYTLMLEDWIIHRAEFVDGEDEASPKGSQALEYFQARLTQ